VTNNTTLLSSASVGGLAIGSVIGARIIAGGRKRIAKLFNIVGIIGCALSMIPNFPIMLIGRAIYGFAAGVHCITGPKMMNETIPAHVLDYGFGCSFNMTINSAIAISLLLGFLVPGKDEVEALKTTKIWIFIYAFPILFFFITHFLLTVVHKQDSLYFHI
jgi:MFS family permease